MRIVPLTHQPYPGWGTVVAGSLFALQSFLFAQSPDDASTASPGTPPEIVERSTLQKEIYRQSCNSVVRIEMSDPLGSTLATGFFIDDEGLVATVISTNRNPDKISISWQEKSYDAELLAVDERTRLALIKIKAEMTPELMISRGSTLISEDRCSP